MRQAPKELIAKASKAIQRKLEQIGWRKRKGDIFTYQLSNDVVGIVGLNRAVQRGDGVLEINSVVGVRHQPLERLVAEAADEKFSPYITATIGIHLGYLMPERKYRPWLFDSDSDFDAMADQLTKQITEYGLPFIQENTELESLINTMTSSEFGPLPKTRYQLPAAYFLSGNLKLAAEFLQLELMELEGDETMAAAHYRKFAKALSEKIRAAGYHTTFD